MIATAEHTHQGISVYSYDPTRTTTLRKAFVTALNKRFNELTRVIRETVYTNDAFGLGPGVEFTPLTFQMVAASPGAFNFPRSADKVEAFMKWLQVQVDSGMISVLELDQVGVGVEGAWTNKYIQDSYKRGIIRARYEMKKVGFDVPSIEATGGIDIAFGTPFHMDRVGLLYSRTFSELKGITATMDQQISRVLAQGIADGDNPLLLARKLVSSINGSGMGELGLKDTLGRFIPAKRRAEIMARTEIVRAHHQATIQEYRNWAVEGVVVKAEWMTAGDNRVCNQCADMEGSVFTLDVIEKMIPLHPQCFIDYQIPIYTSKGWKKIGDVKVGDMVLTHKHRFKKVTQLIRNKQICDVVKFKFKGDLHLSMTENHPILIKKYGIEKWIKAKEITTKDKVFVLANTCKRCGKEIPYFRKYCSRTCLSKDITDKQWSDETHRKNISKKTSKQLIREYELGIRDKNKITKNANEKTRKLIKDGKFHLNTPEIIAKCKLVTNTKEMREASSKRMQQNNPMFDLETRKKVSKSLQELFEKYPEKRLNARMAKHRKSGRKTSIEKKVAKFLDFLGIDYVFQYPILRYNVDFAIPDLHIVIECDGEYWHKDKKEQDLIRQKNIEEQGWFVLRYTDTEINKKFGIVTNELKRVLCNHTGNYKTVELEIEKIEKYQTKTNKTTYNLSVEEDESYLAKGVVVHNCRCIALPYKQSMITKKLLPDWPQ